MPDPSDIRKKNKIAALVIAGVVLGMLVLPFASIPLYRLYCQISGYGGQAVQDAGKTNDIQVLDRTVTVRFNTDVDSGLSWEFVPDQPPVTVKIGQETLISFTATNTGDKPVAGTALYNVSPPVAGVYFRKTQCFCFDYQIIAPGQSVHFPVVFYIDPEMDQDPQLNDLTSMTLSYSFYRADSPELERALEDFYNSDEKSRSVEIK